jgi:polyisoprenoid-binding protein YceI
MKRVNFAILVATTMLFSAFTISKSIKWKIADGYSIKFSSKEPTGVFTKLNGDVVFDENNLAGSKFDVKVDVASINTGNGMQNKHAKSDKWFDAEKYPTINFTSNKFAKTASGYTVTGMLEMHGVKKELTMPFTFKNNTFNSSFTVNRTDFELGPTTGMSGNKVAHELKLDISVPVAR